MLIASASLSTHAAAAINAGDVEPVSSATEVDVSKLRTNDFFIRFLSASGDESKFVTYGWLGWSPKVIHWLYNDANRPAGLSATPSAAVASIQSAMSKWTAACNIQFVYDGATSAGPSLSGLNFNGGGGTRDGLNVIAWGSGGNLSGNTTGITFVSASSSGGPFRLDEGDIAINYAFNPNLDVTLVHEVGHLIGLNHSDVQNAVMSGPPLTSYVSLSALTADDIAGCQNLYGPPVSTARTITGSITNGGGIAGVTFCARPSAGVSCTASIGSGAYSCTVPNGWTGTLHSPSVANNRIPPQTFAAVNANVTRNVAALSGVPSCNLDVDNNGLIEAATDGVAIMRRMLGFKDAAFAGLAGTCAANTTSTAIFNATNSNYNVTGGSETRAATDGAVILRVMSGLKTDASVTGGLGLVSEPGVTNTSWSQIQSWLNTTCGSNF
ncbi:MAG: matrixin family metalloprotease [Casimicrobium sp.]